GSLPGTPAGSHALLHSGAAWANRLPETPSRRAEFQPAPVDYLFESHDRLAGVPDGPAGAAPGQGGSLPLALALLASGTAVVSAQDVFPVPFDDKSGRNPTLGGAKRLAKPRTGG